MPCYHPIRGYRSKSGRNENGKWPVVFSVNDGYRDMPVEMPCGRCIGCRLEKSKQWAIRCMHELKFHDQACYITLTYNEKEFKKLEIIDETEDKHIYSLNKKHVQLFLKRLRKKIKKKFYIFNVENMESSLIDPITI